MLYNPNLDEPDTCYLTAHAWRFMQLTPKQRLDWYELFNTKMQTVVAMPHDTVEEMQKRVLAGMLVWEEMERWTLEQIAANIEADLIAQSLENQPDQDQDQEADNATD